MGLSQKENLKINVKNYIWSLNLKMKLWSLEVIFSCKAIRNLVKYNYYWKYIFVKT